MSLVRAIDKKFYTGFERNWDDQLFRKRILAAVWPESTVLDLGAGAGIVEAMNFRGIVAKVCGVDLDPRVTANPFLDEGGLPLSSGPPDLLARRLQGSSVHAATSP